MKFIKSVLITLVIAICLGFAGFVFVNFYSIIFSRHVTGIIIRVERVDVNVALMQAAPGEKLNPELYSFAVAIKQTDGEIVTASAEDRQWSVAQAGQCAEAVYYPYPPWRFDKANTYYGARLEKLYECPVQATEATE
jgi:hypothetical protein